MEFPCRQQLLTAVAMMLKTTTTTKNISSSLCASDNSFETKLKLFDWINSYNAKN